MIPGIDTGGGGFSGSSAATAGDIGGSGFGGVNIGSGSGLDQQTIIIMGAIALVALFLLKR